MKITRILLTLTLVLTMAMSLASCEVIDANVQGLIDEATAQLNQTIESLEATKTELENAKATLEKAKTELEAAKSALEGEKEALEGENAALEDRIERLLRCVEGDHDMELTPNGDGTHTEACLYCESSTTQNCTFLDYVDNGDGSFAATCPTCNNTNTVDASQLFVVVRSEDELREAARVDGTKIRLGADIDVLDCIYIDDNTYVEIDMAGYSINCDDPSLNEFFVYGSLRIYDSVGGSSITNGFNTYDGTYLKVGNIKLKYYDPIGMKGTIDLSEYRGGELKMYVADFTDLIIPEGYSFYQEIDDEVIPDFAAAKEAGWVRIVPTN